MPRKSTFTSATPQGAVVHHKGKPEGREPDLAFPGELLEGEFLASPWVGWHYSTEYCWENPSPDT
jgi:hypothetical protein